MTSSLPQKRTALAVASSIVFVLGFPAITVLVDGGEMFGAFMILPLALIAWSWGARTGIVAALVGIAFTNAVFSPHYLMAEHHPLTPYWFIITIAPALVFIFVGSVVGRLSEALVELQRTLEERQAAETARQESEEHFRHIFMNAPFGYFRSTLEGKALTTNPAFARMLGYESVEEALDAVNAKGVAESLYKDPAQRAAIVSSILRTNQWQRHDVVFRRKDGAAINTYLTIRLYSRPDEEPKVLEGFVEDVTDRRILEQQLLHSQKMEAVGRLAGGVAHDFNNILMVILGYAEALKGFPEDGLQVADAANAIGESAKRAAALTSQLLAFSRKQILQPKVLDVLSLVQRMETMLTRSLGEDIALCVVSSDQSHCVRADESQLQQVVLNLAVNARDAMPRGGRLTMKAGSAIFLETDSNKPQEVVPGEYVTLTVSDTGSGMDQETLSHLFEPFYTTKAFGKGTGLGLSIVYGIVKQSLGYVYVQSQLAFGTTFTIYLPRVHEAPEDRTPSQGRARRLNGSETVLLAEDEASVRTLMRRSLEDHGYTVLEASDGAEALRISETANRLDLLLTDVVMPGVGGADVARAFRKSRPGAPVILVTGYADRAELDGDESFLLLSKPVSMDDLLTKVREALASRR